MDKTVVIPKILVPLSPAWFKWRIGSARQGAANTAIDSRPFINCVRDIKRHKAWEVYFKDGEKTWERFCKELLDTEPEFVDQVEIGVEVLEEAGHFGPIPEKQAIDVAMRARNAKELMEHRRPTKEESDDKGNNVTFIRGNNPDYLAARIKRDRPDIHERMKAGEYKSVRAAAKDAGIIRELATLEKAQKLWLKMTAKERAAFQKWTKEQ